MKKVIKFLPVAAIVLGSGLAMATTQKSVSGSYAPVPETVHSSGWVNIHSLPPGYVGYECDQSLETCLYNTPNLADPADEKGTFRLIPG